MEKTFNKNVLEGSMQQNGMKFRVSNKILGSPYFSNSVQGLCKQAHVTATGILKKRVPGAMISVRVNSNGTSCFVPITLFSEHPPIELLEKILSEKGVLGGSNSLIAKL